MVLFSGKHHEPTRQKVNADMQDLCKLLLSSRLTVVSHEAKEEAASGCPDRLETHTHEYFTETRALKIENAIIKCYFS